MIMRIIHWRKLVAYLTLIGCGLLPVAGSTQLKPGSLKDYLIAPIQANKLNAKQIEDLKQFYSVLNYEPVWLSPGKSDVSATMFRLITYADYYGLNPDKYHINEFTNHITRSANLRNLADSAGFELLLTLSAIDFFRDLRYGDTGPNLGYNGLHLLSGSDSVASMVALHVIDGKLTELQRNMNSGFGELTPLMKKLAVMLDQTELQAGWDPLITSPECSQRNKPLLQKLSGLGIITGTVADSAFTGYIRAAQRMFNLPADGVPGKQTLEQLNVPLSVRIRELNLAINYFRWLNKITGNRPLILVNIPATILTVYQNDSAILTMRMIVGKASTPTPTLSSVVDKLILYPYWTVPHSIAVNELLPVFKRDPSYVQNGNYQVLDKNSRIVNPRQINWQHVRASDFPYTIRQSTGCDNALGLLKLDFESPFGVYLHDTPVKLLFTLPNRFFSHGCMRMEKPMELGRLLLGEDTRAIDTLTEKGCLKNQSPITVPARNKMSVLVWYNPVHVESNGEVIFYRDVYHKFPWLKN